MSRFTVSSAERRTGGCETDVPATAPAPRMRAVGGVIRRGAVVGAVTVLAAGLGGSADAASKAANGDPVISGATVNSGHDVIVGITHDVVFPVTVSGSDDSGLLSADADLKGPHGGFYTTDTMCQSESACTMAFTVNAHLAPGSDDPVDLANANAGTWSVDTLVDANDGGSAFASGVGTFGLKRAARLTVNASPEPVAKGAKITVTGKLVRANWDTYRYAGYAGRAVKLQFRPKGSSTYTTVATVNTNSTGNLSTTVKAVRDGYWRWNFTGSTTTGPAKAPGDYVDVRP
ncbi:calcium-binding protein [Streptomyces sp. CA-249302]|uniref:calcium-binding protein n=1 Tax=Streptomyces sp. CA-249302 TaxID=3240058 RepID=UPI003D8C007D